MTASIVIAAAGAEDRAALIKALGTTCCTMEAPDAESALAWLQKPNRIDAVLLDADDWNVPSFLCTLRAEEAWVHLPVLVLSEEERDAELLAMGASDCLRKNCAPALLLLRLGCQLQLRAAAEREAQLKSALAAVEKHGEALRTRAETDELTGLFNRCGFRAALERQAAAAPDAHAAFIMLDLDNFKQLNDTYGHQCGDEALRYIGARMSAQFRSQDAVGRLGGDEFVAFMQANAGAAPAERRVQALLSSLSGFSYEGCPIPCTCSAGIALFPEHGTNFEVLYCHADHALYQAKRSGKNGYVLFGAPC